MNKKDHILNGVLLAVGLGIVLHPAGDLKALTTIVEVFVPVVLGTMLPDIDTEFGRHRKTLHNVFVIAALYGYVVYFGNLEWVWVGALSHFLLDMVGSKRGLALFYPLWDREFAFPFGVKTSSGYATIATVVITVLELAALAAALYWVPTLIPSGIDVTNATQAVSLL
ncbi:metal-dependent hydrolase [Halocalculus aciditolerans]|uniref:Membrane protein n=1 Tax=Halocalculus aciditolerans TaxID=1383812 RepID=A0A830FD55_9EURY|nr:metal-dependent hydrolase [Halocalculus aciditolerans]GGL63374.1 membrane protein [Halocalculus aciditolerans]